MVKLVAEKDFYHSVAVIKHNDNYYYADPYNEYAFPVDRIILSKQFIGCWSIHRPILRNGNWAILNGESIGYDFLKDLNTDK